MLALAAATAGENVHAAARPLLSVTIDNIGHDVPDGIINVWQPFTHHLFSKSEVATNECIREEGMTIFLTKRENRCGYGANRKA